MYLIASYKCNVHTNCIFWQNKYTDTETECGLLNSKHETSHFPDVLKVLLENVKQHSDPFLMFSAIYCSTRAFYSLSLAPTDKIIPLYARKHVVTRDDLQGQFLAQHSFATLLRHSFQSNQ